MNVAPPIPDLYDVAFLDGYRGVAVGAAVDRIVGGPSRPDIIVTSDGGAHWRHADLGFLRRELDTWLTGVCFTPTGHAVAVATGSLASPIR